MNSPNTPHKRPRPVSPLLAPLAPSEPSDPIVSSPSSTTSHPGGGSAAATAPLDRAPTSTGQNPPGSAGAGGGSASSTFRNVSACNRCRLRKNRCDQNLPACTACDKARVRCVGYDPILKREIPRAYVYYLESRCAYLEGVLQDRGIAVAPPEDFDAGARPLAAGAAAGNSSGDGGGWGKGPSSPGSQGSSERYYGAGGATTTGGAAGAGSKARARGDADGRSKQDEADSLNKLVSNIGMVSVQGASDPRFLGSTSGISFARVVFAAVRSSISGSTSERASLRPGKPLAAIGLGPNSGGQGGSSMRDSFFGLQSKPAYRQAPFPDKELGGRLAHLYFENANPQIPILHRGDFMELFEKTYATEERRRAPRELYLLNIVFAIGAGIILGGAGSQGANASAAAAADDAAGSKIKADPDPPQSKRPRLSSRQYQPEEYHASAMVHLEYFLGSAPAADRPEGFGASMEELQAVLLLAGFALLRPVAPGLWYIVGVAVRLAVDLGLHYEDGIGVDEATGPGVARSRDVALEATSSGARSARHATPAIDSRERGRREWIRDLRRRLWWCVYSFDRLVSTCVGRPFGITDQVITTEFPSLLDDRHITTAGIRAPADAAEAAREPSYKRVAQHYWRLRLLQSEILQVLQHRQARQVRATGRNRANAYMHTRLPSPFLYGHADFAAWRRDIDRRLWQWKESAPPQGATGVAFDSRFLELNYWQAMIMLYRQSLSVPAGLGKESSPSDELASPMDGQGMDEEEEDEEVFVKVAEAGQRVLKLYYQLNRQHIVNYTFLATHHLFMAGIAFLYAIWHSPLVRTKLTYEDVDYTILAAMTVLSNLMEKCPPAEACRDAFDRMAKATVAMCLSTTGFGTRNPVFGVPQPQFAGHSAQASTTLAPPNILTQQPQPPQQPYFPAAASSNTAASAFQSRPRPQFDMNLRDLFPEDTTDRQNFRSIKWGAATPTLPSSSGSARPPALPHAQPVLAAPPAASSLAYPSQPALRGSVSPASTHATLASATTASQPGGGLAGSYASYAPSAPALDDASSYTPDASAASAFQPADLGPGGWDSGALDLDSLLADAAGAYPGSAGMSLGFDADHDWNDGCGPDLLDGYWFRSGWPAGSGLNGAGGAGGYEGGEGMVVGMEGEMEVGDDGQGEGDVRMG